MRSRADFEAVARVGKRASRGALVVSASVAFESLPERSRPPQVGVIVGRRVGAAATRNRVRRQLRHQLAERVQGFPRGALVVVRARPGIAEQSRASVTAALDEGLGAVGLGPRRVMERSRR
ncbi:MAG: ribonuclease P protein component [Frankiaceae bacterium]